MVKIAALLKPLARPATLAKPTKSLEIGVKAKTKATKPTKPKIKLEHTDQVIFTAKLKTFYPDVLGYAVPNGGSRGELERVRLAAEGVRAGVYDYCIQEARGGYFGLYLEFKRLGRQNEKNGGQSETQVEFAAAAHRKGYCCIVVYGHKHAWDVFNWYMDFAVTIPVR